MNRGQLHRKWNWGTKLQILNDAVCVPLCTNALGKDMTPSVLPPAISKIGQIGFSFDKATSLREEKLRIQNHFIPLKKKKKKKKWHCHTQWLGKYTHKLYVYQYLLFWIWEFFYLGTKIHTHWNQTYHTCLLYYHFLRNDRWRDMTFSSSLYQKH